MRLLWPCLLTMALETGFFALTGYRDRAFLALCLCVNAATNLTLNLLLGFLPFTPQVVYPLELAVLALEYLAYGLALGRSRRLFWLTAAANVLSYCLGGLIYGFC